MIPDQKIALPIGLTFLGIKTNPKRKVIGKNIKNTLANDQTAALWRSFIPELPGIANRKNEELISAGIYPENYFHAFSPELAFQKWAGCEIEDAAIGQNNLSVLLIPEGTYAVFHYCGNPADKSIFAFLYGAWMQSNGLIPNDAPHFELLGSNYKNNSEDSEEEIWIPVRPV